MLPVATHTYKNHRIALYADDSPESPRDWDTLGTLVCWHRRYRLGDALPEALRSYRPHHGDSDSLDRFQAWMHQERRNLLILPVYLYDHSGLALATTPFSCPWDSGQVGWIFASHAQIRAAFGVRRLTTALLARATATLRNEVETYSRYLDGDVYGYQLFAPDAAEDSAEQDSCWGFYGQADCFAAACGSVDAHLMQI
jgi:hypothetical protein